MEKKREPKLKNEGLQTNLTDQINELQDKIKHLEFIANVSQEDNNMGTWEVDLIKNKQIWSENYCRLLGYSKKIDEPDEEIFYSHIYPEDLNIVKNTMHTCMKSKTPCSLEFRYYTKEQELRYARSTANYIFDDNKQITRIIGVFQDITQGKTDEIRLLYEKEKAEERELLLNEMGKIARVGGWRLNIKTSDLTWTREVFQIHEVDDGYIPNVESAINFYDKSSQQIITKSLNETIETGKPFDTKLKIITAKGNIIDVRAIGNASRNNAGEIEFVYGTFQDISDRVKGENEVLESRQKFKSLFDNIEEGVALHEMIFDENDKPVDFIWVDANPKYEELTGLKAKDIIGRKGKEIIPNIEQYWYDMYARVTLTGTPESTIDYSEYLNKYWDVKAFKPVDGHFAVAMTDVTERIEAENQLKNSESRYRALYDNAPLSYQSLDINGNFIDINPTWLSTLGYRKEDVLGKNFGDFLHPDWKEHFKKNFPKFKRRGYISDVQFKIKHKNGQYADISFEGCVGTNPDGSFKQTYCVFKDITEQKVIEDSLIKNQYYLSKAQEIGRIGTWELDIITNKLVWTRQNYLNFGVEYGTPLDYEIFLNCVHPDDREFVNNEWMAAINGKPYDIEHRVVIGDDVRWLREKADVEFDESGKAISAIGFSQDITLFKKSQQAIQLSEGRFKSLVENIPVGLFRSTSEGKIISTNKAMVDIYGYDSPEELMNIQAEDFYTESNPRVIMLERLKKKGVLNDYVTKERKKDGSIIWVSTTYRLIEDEVKNTGCDFCIDGVVIDVTKRKLAEVGLQRSEDRFQIAMKASQDGLFDWNLLTNEIYYSPGWKRMLGYEEHELPNDFSVWETLTEEQDVKRSWEVQQKLINREIDRFELEFKMKHKNGHWIDILSRADALFDKNGKAVRIVGTHVNITELRENEKSISNLSDIIQNSVNEIFLFNADDYKFVYANNSALNNLGYTFDELKKKTPIDIKPEIDELKFNQLVTPLRENEKESVKFETIHERKDGSVYNVSVTMQMLDYNNRQVISAIIIDISDKIAFENELINARKKAEESDKLKTAFLANMSHEIRTPMNGIHGFTELLQNPNLSKHSQKEYARIIQKSSDRLLETVNDIIDISKIESGEMKVSKDKIDIIECINSLVSTFIPEIQKKNLKVTFENEKADKEVFVVTDEAKLSSIITNLLKNAIKYTLEGSIKMGFNISKGKLLIYCKDTGIGIPDERIEAVFNRFEQADIEDKRAFEGSGLGLAIAKSYVEMMKGKIWVESELGVGSTFYVSLPYLPVRDINTDTHNVEEHTSSDRKQAHVLIAEDDETSAMHLSILCESIFTKVTVVENGAEAVEAVMGDSSIKIIFMDIKMPKMDGYKATDRIRQIKKDILIIAQTAYAFDEDKRRLLNSGFDDYISKPISKDKLMELIANYI